jgi:hypothetical protein
MAGRREHTRYALRDVLATWGGIDLNVNTGQTDFVSVKRKSPKLSSVASADGSVVVVESYDDRADVTVTCAQNSSLNARLQAMYDARAVGAFSLKDLNGSVRAEAGAMWIVDLPEVKRGKESTDHVWPFECAELVTEIAGATPLAAQQGA